MSLRIMIISYLVVDIYQDTQSFHLSSGSGHGSVDCRGRSLSACKLEFSAEESTDHFVRVAVAANTSDTVQFAISVDLQGNA